MYISVGVVFENYTVVSVGTVADQPQVKGAVEVAGGVNFLGPHL